MKDYEDIFKNEQPDIVTEVADKPVEPMTDELFGEITSSDDETQKPKNGFVNFIKRNSFYIAIIVAVSAASYVSFNAVTDMIQEFTRPATERISEEQWTNTPNDQNSLTEQETQPVTNSQDTPTQPSLPSSSLVQEPILPESADLPVESSNTEQPPKDLYVLPVNGQITKGFSGDKLVFCETMGDWRTHNGIDITAPEGTEAVALSNGIVQYAGQSDLWGLVVEIKLETGYTAIYANLGSVSDIKAGQAVLQGDEVGTVGTSSIIEKGDEPHLHLEIISGEEFVDPLSLIND